MTRKITPIRVPARLKLPMVIGKDIQDLAKVRIPGMTKDFDKLTISELVQIRVQPSVQDSYTVTGFTDNITVSTDAILAELGSTSALATMKAAQSRLIRP